MFKIPFTIASEDKLKKRFSKFISLVKFKKSSKFKEYIENCGASLSREEYLGICNGLFFRNFFVVLFITFLITFYLRTNYLFIPAIAAIVFPGFLFYLQLTYPKSFSLRKQRSIEKNLVSALQDMLVQLNSGIPIYTILINIAYSNYGFLSEEFKLIVKKINAGMSQAEVIEASGDKNSSLYFRRTLWQISNGMKAGSDISIVVKESIVSLGEEQLIQIQNYGSKLNPIIMFYMLMTIIMPALAITFLTIVTSLVSMSQAAVIFIFGSLLGAVAFFQIMFLGAIKSIRPTLI